MNKTFKNCQSCGMPMARDEHGGGTEADGSKSMMYCSRNGSVHYASPYSRRNEGSREEQAGRIRLPQLHDRPLY